MYIRVKEHEYYQREGNDLFCVVPISMTQAALGAEIQVSTLEDSRKIKVKIPAGTQNGKILRLKSEGVPLLHHPERRGDLYVRIMVEVPTKISGQARNLLEQLSLLTGEEENPRPVRLSELK